MAMARSEIIKTAKRIALDYPTYALGVTPEDMLALLCDICGRPADTFSDDDIAAVELEASRQYRRVARFLGLA